MVENILDCITDPNNVGKETKKQALQELRTLLEKVELGIEEVSKRDSEWYYGDQLKDVKIALENTNLESLTSL